MCCIQCHFQANVYHAEGPPPKSSEGNSSSYAAPSVLLQSSGSCVDHESKDVQSLTPCDFPSASNLLASDASLSAEYAIKIFKTSILVFKGSQVISTAKLLMFQQIGINMSLASIDLEMAIAKGACGCLFSDSRYIDCSNPRKMVRLWAEKEMRNLRRFHVFK